MIGGIDYLESLGTNICTLTCTVLIFSVLNSSVNHFPRVWCPLQNEHKFNHKFIQSMIYNRSLNLSWYLNLDSLGTVLLLWILKDHQGSAIWKQLDMKNMLEMASLLKTEVWALIDLDFARTAKKIESFAGRKNKNKPISKISSFRHSISC